MSTSPPTTTSSLQTIVVRQSPWAGSDPAERLLNFIEEFSKPPQKNDSSPPKQYRLNLLCVHLTPRVLNLLIELLNVTLPHGENGEESRWEAVLLHQCRIVQHSVYFPMEQNEFAFDDISRLGATLSRRACSLVILESPGLVDCVLSAPRLDMTSLVIHHRSGLSATECSKLGDLVQQSPNLKELNLHSTFLEAPDQLAKGLGVARHLESLCLGDNFGPCATPKQRRQALADLVVEIAANDHIHDSYKGGAVSRLLQDPKSQLKCLDLSGLELKDDHLIAISQLLVSNQESNPATSTSTATNESCSWTCSSKLQELNVSFNKIYSRSILDFAQRLPAMKFLRKVTLGPNPWDESSKVDQCKAALLQGLVQSASVEYLDSFLDMPQAILLHQHVLLNRAGRRILTASDPVPLGLWSQIMERAGTIISYPPPIRNMNVSDQESRANAIFFLLSNGPMIS